MPTKTAALYARFSPGREQTEQSIEGQVRVCEEYAKAHGIAIIATYIDRRISGRREDRPEFQRMIADSAAKKWDTVLVYRTDRFGRSKYDIAVYKHKLSQHGVKVLPAAEATVDGPEGIILEALMEGLAEYYSAELSQKVSRGMKESAYKGKATGGTRVLGYRTAADKSYIIDQEEAQTVRRIFDLYIKGTPTQAICDEVNGLGLKNTWGKSFRIDGIKSVLQNSKYTGVFKYGEYQQEGAMPEIISAETFEVVQREMRKRSAGRKPKSPKAEYLLIGKLFCGHCKSSMVGISGTGRNGAHYYYQCPAKRRGTCDKQHVRRDWIEQTVVEETLRHNLRPEFLPELAHKIYENQTAQDNADEIKHFKRLLVENQKAQGNIMKAIEAGMFSPALQSRMAELEKEAENLRGEVAFFDSQRFELTEEQIHFLLESFAEMQEDESLEDYHRRIIRTFVSQVFLYDGKMLIYYNICNGEALDSSVVDELAERFAAGADCSTRLALSRKSEKRRVKSEKFAARRANMHFSLFSFRFSLFTTPPTGAKRLRSTPKTHRRSNAQRAAPPFCFFYLQPATLSRGSRRCWS
jgi:DNA invertase Pin-like site-specific DNA recombinase